jgi:hypothetical protein
LYTYFERSYLLPCAHLCLSKMIAHPYQGKNTFDHLLGLMILQIINKLPRFPPNFFIQKRSENLHQKSSKIS